MAKNEVSAQVPAQAMESKEPIRYNTDFSLGIFGSSDNFMMATQMAKAFANSTIVPQEYRNNFSNGLVAIDIANRLKTSPLTVMQNLDIIQGRPSWRASFLIGMINGSGKYDIELQFDEKQDKQGNPYSCICWTEKNGRKVTGITITMDIAKAEGWTSKNGSKWRTMPQVMLRYRAASFFARMNCPELTLGLYTKEEIIDGDFKEYAVEGIQQEVKHEIAANANKEEFVPDQNDGEMKIPFEIVDDEQPKPEKKPETAKERPKPNFM